jgi:hypothetical protein
MKPLAYYTTTRQQYIKEAPIYCDASLPFVDIYQFTCKEKSYGSFFYRQLFVIYFGLLRDKVFVGCCRDFFFGRQNKRIGNEIGSQSGST